MTMADVATGPTWVIYIGAAIFTILCVILISGHGSWLIAGYNMMSKVEKEQYDERKLCRVTGIGMGVIAVLLIIISILQQRLPASFIYIFLAIVIIDVVTIIILQNTICKKQME